MFVFSYKINRHTWTEFIHLSAEAALSAENQCQLWKMSEGLLFFQQHIYYSKSGDIVRYTTTLFSWRIGVSILAVKLIIPRSLLGHERGSLGENKRRMDIYIRCTLLNSQKEERRVDRTKGQETDIGFLWTSFQKHHQNCSPPPLKNNFLQQEKKILSKLMPTRKGESKNVSLYFCLFFLKIMQFDHRLIKQTVWGRNND